jgi:hypothetical protein
LPTIPASNGQSSKLAVRPYTVTATFTRVIEAVSDEEAIEKATDVIDALMDAVGRVSDHVEYHVVEYHVFNADEDEVPM